MAERKNNYAVNQVNLCMYLLANTPLSPKMSEGMVTVRIKCYVTEIHFLALLSCLYHKALA